MTDRGITARTDEETRRLFDKWAATYEADLLHADGLLEGYRRDLAQAALPHHSVGRPPTATGSSLPAGMEKAACYNRRYWAPRYTESHMSSIERSSPISGRMRRHSCRRATHPS